MVWSRSDCTLGVVNSIKRETISIAAIDDKKKGPRITLPRLEEKIIISMSANSCGTMGLWNYRIVGLWTVT